VKNTLLYYKGNGKQLFIAKSDKPAKTEEMTKDAKSAAETGK
jgi:hypothetical protein